LPITRTLALAAAAALCAFTAAVAQPTGGGMQALRAACGDDFARICPDAKDHDSRRQCYLDNRGKFSDTCKAALAAARDKMQAAPAPAPGDAR
jgi:hypothetical protein